MHPNQVLNQQSDYCVPLVDHSESAAAYHNVRSNLPPRQQIEGVIEESSFLTSTVSSNLNDVSQSDADSSMLSSTMSKG